MSVVRKRQVRPHAGRRLTPANPHCPLAKQALPCQKFLSQIVGLGIHIIIQCANRDFVPQAGAPVNRQIF
jgi:hypothetical protein